MIWVAKNLYFFNCLLDGAHTKRAAAHFIFNTKLLIDLCSAFFIITCGSSFYIQHKTPDFEKPGACGIISLCY